MATVVTGEKTILALDIATKTGYAHGAPGQVPRTGCIRFGKPDSSLGHRFQLFRQWCITMCHDVKPDIVIFEAPLAMVGRTTINTSRLLIGLAAICEEYFHGRVDLCEATVMDVRRHFIGSGNLRGVDAKMLTMETCKQLGWEVEDDNAADAAALWHYQASLINPKLGLQVSPLFRRIAE